MSTVVLLLLILPHLRSLISATVFLNQAQDGVFSCRGKMAVITCTTTTAGGFLLWRNSSGKGFDFDGDASAGASGKLGTTRMTLDSIEAVSNAVVYTSRAFKDRFMESTFIRCSDGVSPQSIDVLIKSPSSPSWAYLACSFSLKRVQLSWNAPSVAAECCDQYAVAISTRSVFNYTSETNFTLLIGKESVTATVHCVDHIGEMVTKTEERAINTNIAITQVTIEPVDSSCDANTTYQILWATNTSSQDMCIPPITNWTITCTTSSTHQSSNSSTLCSVPAIETVNVTVTIINAAGFTASKKFASADVLAQACRRLNSALVSSTISTPSPSVTGQLPPDGIAAVIMGLGLLVLAAVCIALVVYIMWNCIKISPQKETYEFKNAVAVTDMDLPKEEETKE